MRACVCVYVRVCGSGSRPQLNDNSSMYCGVIGECVSGIAPYRFSTDGKPSITTANRECLVRRMGGCGGCAAASIAVTCVGVNKPSAVTTASDGIPPFGRV